MQKAVIKFFILALMLLGLPLTGIALSGKPLAPYLEFPPLTRIVEHAGFSLPVFTLLALLALLCVAPLLWRAGTAVSEGKIAARPLTRAGFPWWGWAGLCLGTASWILAWTRMAWFSLLQHHTFIFLWVSYVIVVNALTWRRSGSCMLTDRPGMLALLFPVSAVFWWFFEYLNRFVQNWYYVEISKFSPLEYAVLATLSFSTVLPAVLGTRDFLLTFDFFKKTYGSWVRVRVPAPRTVAALTLVLAGAGLTGIGLLPDLLYPLLWVAPLLIIVSVQALGKEAPVFQALAGGDWHQAVAAALAALICGFFWEMWNYYSLARWVYSVPCVQRWHVFEMPLVGFAGYLPFGLECAVIGAVLSRAIKK